LSSGPPIVRGVGLRPLSWLLVTARRKQAAERKKIGYLWPWSPPAPARDEILALAARHGVPAMYGYREFTDEGGLMSYGPHRPDLYRRTAIYVDKLLKGAKPGDLPIEQPTRFEMIINVKAGARPRPHHPALAAGAGGSGDRTVNRRAFNAARKPEAGALCGF
jgi:hypothetical protein